jgi:outer membrane protein assembly factor BamB
LSWVGKPGAGLAWKTPSLAPGHGSPVVWNNVVFLTGGTAKLREVFAYDIANGQLLWRTAVTNVPGSPAQVPPIPEDTTYAASTGATDGRLFFAIFGNGDVAAVDFHGVVVWSKAFGPLKNAYGHAASLAVWPGMLLVQLDQGENTASNSRLVALDAASGRVLWEKPRALPASWTTPIVTEAAGKLQVVTIGLPSIISYGAADGAELWRAQLLEGELVPSPVLAGGKIIVSSPSARLLALDPGGAGDVTRRAGIWTNLDNAPDITSPVSNDELVFTAGSGGELACMDAATGQTLWTHDVQTQVQASPAIVGDRLFLVGLEGAVIVVEAARTFKEVARASLPDKFLASPAFAGGATFLRGQTNLYCLKP